MSPAVNIDPIVSWTLGQLAKLGIPLDTIFQRVQDFVAHERAQLPPELQAAWTPTYDQIYRFVNDAVGPAQADAVIADMKSDLVNIVLSLNGPAPFENSNAHLA